MYKDLIFTWYAGVNAPGRDDRSVASVLLQVCQSVAHLHEHRVIHCDIKPENIIVDDDGKPRIADFDISVDAEARVTETLTLRGTDKYIAPELRSLHARQPSESSDVYSLGVTLKELVQNPPKELQV